MLTYLISYDIIQNVNRNGCDNKERKKRIYPAQQEIIIIKKRKKGCKMKRRFLKAFFSLTLAVLLVCSLGICAFAAEAGPEYSISMASISIENTNIGDSSVMNFNYAGMLAFKNYVEAASSGRIEVNLYPNATLGNQQEIIQQCMQGVIEVGTASDSDLSNYYPNLQLFTIPYIFSDRYEFYNFLDGDYVQAMHEEIAETCGVRIISAFDNGGFRNFSNNVRQIKTADDVAGLNIRCMQSTAYIKTMEALGAVAQGISFSELYSALQTGVVDGQENAPLVMLDNSIYEQQKYYSLDGHIVSPCYFIVSESWYQSLPEDLQEIVIKGGKLAETAARATIASSEGMALTFLAEKGVEIYSPTEEEKATFQVAREPVAEWLRGEIGTETVDGFLAAIEASKTGEEAAYTGGTTVSQPGDTASATGYIIAIVVLALAAVVLAIKAFRKKPEADNV